MTTGGFSRFARKPGPKDAASVGGKSETLEEQHFLPSSNNGTDTWNSSDFGSGFGFDAGLVETSFGGEIQNDNFPVPMPMEKNANILRNKTLLGVPATMKSPPVAAIDGGRPLGNVTSPAIAFPKISMASMSPPPSNVYDSSHFSTNHTHTSADAPPFITPAPLAKKSESHVEPGTVVINSGSIAGSFEQSGGPFHANTDAARANPRRVTLGGTDTLNDGESPKFSSLKTNISDTEVSEKQEVMFASPLDKLHAKTSTHSQGPTVVSKDESSDFISKTSENASMEEVMVEPGLTESAADSFEEMFQSIMSKNLEFEDGWKNFEDKILDLSADLSMKHGDILELEQAALHLKREMETKFELLLSHVDQL